MPKLETLPVIFRAESNGTPNGSVHVTAVFPTLPGNYDPRTFTVYAHVGQHSAGSPEWYRTTRPATEAESASLLAELRTIYETPPAGEEPAKLVVRRKFVAPYNRERRKACR